MESESYGILEPKEVVGYTDSRTAYGSKVLGEVMDVGIKGSQICSPSCGNQATIWMAVTKEGPRRHYITDHACRGDRLGLEDVNTSGVVVEMIKDLGGRSDAQEA
jgi:hypothetical protein